MKNQLWLRKPVSMFEEERKTSGLRKTLTKWDLAAMGVGAIIGAGIFVLTGLGAKEYAGPALAFSFIIAGIGCAFAALCYAEFASMIPVEGSVYSYSYATMGELFAWIIGWDLTLEYAMACASVSVGWSGYLSKLLLLFNIKFPLWLMSDYATASTMVADATAKGETSALLQHYSSLDFPSIMGIPISFNLPAFLIVAFITIIIIRGIKEAANTNLVMVAIKVAVILFVIIAGAFLVNVDNWHPFVPERIYDTAGNGHYGWLGVLTGSAYIFFAYIGFDAVSTQAGEAKNPKTAVPFGIIVSLAVCTVLYIAVSLVLTGMVNYKDIDITAPIAAAFADHNQGYAVLLISVAAVAGLTSVILVMLVGQSRLFFAMSKDGLLPSKFFGALHSKFKTPYKSSILIGLVVGLVAAFTPIDSIAKMVNIGTLLAFILVAIAVWIMRKREPNIERPFRTPYLPVVAVLGIFTNLAMMLSLELINWLRLMIWLAIGLVIYFIYSRRHSTLPKKLQESGAIK